VLESLEGSEFSALMRSEFWGWPLVLTVHVLGTAVVMGFVVITSLRMLGLFETIPYTSLRRLFPVIWVAIAVQVVSGFLLWMTKPTQYVVDGAFMLKLALVIAGIVLTSYFYGELKREGASWEAAGAGSSRGNQFSAASLVVWCCALVAARLTAYLGSF